MNDEAIIHRIIGEKIKSVKKLELGVSNISYLVDNKYVVRIKKSKDHFYSYKSEKEALHKTARAYLSEVVIYLDKDGNKVSEYIPNTNIFTGKDDEIIKTAIMLKKLHTFKVNSKTKFNALKRYKYYKSHSHANGFSEENKIIKKVKKIYKKYDLVMCHNDIVDNNLLFTNNRSYLIDYEYAGKNIYLFDLASFITENNITSQKKIKLFLKSYGFNNKDLDDLNTMMIFLDIFWYYWANERYLNTHQEIFKKIALDKKNRILNS